MARAAAHEVACFSARLIQPSCIGAISAKFVMQGLDCISISFDGIKLILYISTSSQIG